MKFIYITFCIIWFVVFIGAVIYLYFKNIKPYKPVFNDNIFDKIPNEYKPVELSLLMYNKIVPSVLSATIIDLFNKGILILNNEDNCEYIMYNHNYTQKMSIFENSTAKLLIETIGDRNRVSIKEIDDFCNHKSNCDKFLLEYQIWYKIARKEYASARFYESKLQYEKVKIIMWTGFILFIINLVARFNTCFGYLIVLPAISIMVLFVKSYKRTVESNEEYHKWLSFKNYLNISDLKSIPVEEYNKYIMYSTVLNVPNIELKLTNHNYYTRITSALNKCIIKSILNGNRKLF